MAQGVDCRELGFCVGVGVGIGIGIGVRRKEEEWAEIVYIYQNTGLLVRTVS